MNLFTVYAPHIAAELMFQGFTLVRTEPSKKDPRRVVYLFENTLDFQIALKKLTKK